MSGHREKAVEAARWSEDWTLGADTEPTNTSTIALRGRELAPGEHIQVVDRAEAERKIEQARQDELERSKEAVLSGELAQDALRALIADAPEDSGLPDVDCTDLFRSGHLKHHEIGDTGEKEARLTPKGYELIHAALNPDQHQGSGGAS